jgi:hypothetical protein
LSLDAGNLKGHAGLIDHLASVTGDEMPDDPQVRRMRTTIWVDDKPLQDALLAELERAGYSPRKLPENKDGWWGVRLRHSGQQASEVSRTTFSICYPQRMRHDPV